MFSKKAKVSASFYSWQIFLPALDVKYTWTIFSQACNWQEICSDVKWQWQAPSVETNRNCPLRWCRVYREKNFPAFLDFKTMSLLSLMSPRRIKRSFWCQQIITKLMSWRKNRENLKSFWIITEENAESTRLTNSCEIIIAFGKAITGLWLCLWTSWTSALTMRWSYLYQSILNMNKEADRYENGSCFNYQNLWLAVKKKMCSLRRGCQCDSSSSHRQNRNDAVSVRGSVTGSRPEDVRPAKRLFVLSMLSINAQIADWHFWWIHAIHVQFIALKMFLCRIPFVTCNCMCHLDFSSFKINHKRNCTLSVIVGWWYTPR